MPLKRNWPAGVGLALGFVAVVSYYTVVTRTISPYAPWTRDLPVPNLVLLAIALGLSGLAVVLAFRKPVAYRGRILAPAFDALNSMLAALFVFHLFVLSARLPDPAGAPQVGTTAPDFTLSDQRGQPLQLSSLRGKNVLLVFYRGHW